MDQEHAGQEVARLADDWIAAELHGDVPFLERTIADDFVAVGPLGFMLTKREWIARHQSGNMKYDALTLDEVTVRMYDRAAVLIGRQAQDAAFRGNSVKAQLRVTAVLVHRKGQWQLVGVQMSPIGQPPSFAQS
ncbi:MAG TPA: nuclear transport factor 2 family protein [Chloroflexota bacterium]